LLLLDVLNSVIITSLLLYVVLSLLYDRARRVLLYSESRVLSILLFLIRLDLVVIIVVVRLGVDDVRGLNVKRATMLAEGAAVYSRFRRYI
jgi:hypothetical protein